MDILSRLYSTKGKGMMLLISYSKHSEVTMKKVFRGFAISLLASFIISGAALAGGGAQTGDQDGTPDQDRDWLRDGSCLDIIQQNQNKMLLLVRNGQGIGDQDGTPDQDRDWLRDGSCLAG
jgi:hypothetical protein